MQGGPAPDRGGVQRGPQQQKTAAEDRGVNRKPGVRSLPPGEERANSRATSMGESMNGICRRLMSGLTALLIASCAIAQPAPHKALELIVFPGGFNWPVWIAQEKGLFAKNGIEVRLTPTVSSVFQLTNLIDGKYDIAMTAIDNLIAYREGQGEEPVLGRDLQAVTGGGNACPRPV